MRAKAFWTARATRCGDFHGLSRGRGPNDPIGRTLSGAGRPVTLAFTGPDGAVRPFIFSGQDDRLGDMARQVDNEFSQTLDAGWDHPGGIRVADKKPGNSQTAMKLVQDSEVIRRSETFAREGFPRLFRSFFRRRPKKHRDHRRDLTVSGLGLNPPTLDTLRMPGAGGCVEDELAGHFSRLSGMGLAIFDKAMDHAQTPDLTGAAAALDLSRFTSSRIRADAAGAVVARPTPRRAGPPPCWGDSGRLAPLFSALGLFVGFIHEDSLFLPGRPGALGRGPAHLHPCVPVDGRGYDARVLHHKRGYRYPWADDPAPVVYLATSKAWRRIRRCGARGVSGHPAVVFRAAPRRSSP